MNNREILKSWDLFPSPPWVVDLLVEAANIELGISCLEPSAGFGTLAASLQKAGALVEVIEPIPELQTILALQGLLLIGSDFLTTPIERDRYERVVQNPPFSQQISHVKRAYQCLKAGGRLVSLVSHSPWQYNTSFYQQFRYWLNAVNAQVQELPWGLFVNSDRYTSVECCLIIIDKI
ncbi:MAG: hypothetical protein N4J56_004527 [Chroococcidiopsis sp. SAG 2025]|uniref:hypothetical protein n=1 Tax=Chroococcidiopsis sp. SAG 2025 TaxID=171389 RepID=UPI0029370A37|nr:hypothetical protein [Chroococcidiopsis sp. SAG 2025]MDV2994873.1 hypothetical protein [Chroococcidiopsis sp. SAG 2025]